MKKYLTFLKLGWLDAMEYRTEFLIGYIGWFVSFIIAVFIWLAVLKNTGGTLGGYDIKSIVTYFLIIQILRTLIFSRAGFEINQDIQSGDLSQWLLKPVAYLPARFVIEFSNNFLRSLFGICFFGIIIFFYNPAFFVTLTLGRILLIPLIVIMCYTISFLFISTIAVTAFWVVNANRFLFIYFSILTIFSGMIIPIDLFPQKVSAIILMTPFPYIFYFPAKFILGTLPNALFAKGLLVALFYIVFISFCLTIIHRAGIKKFEAVGK